ncbi:MAG: hypothetical protein ACI85K_000078 [Hyphomicrobiaceae bacterium]|jgi:hypothetical protein
MRTLSMALLLGACSAPTQLFVPVAVVGDGEADVLLAHEVLPAFTGESFCWRASEPEHWAPLCHAFGDAMAARVEPAPSFDDQQFVGLSLPPGMGLTGIVISSEEGVDVITLDIAAGDSPGVGCLLQMSRRTCQMAIIVRDQQLGEERTAAVLSGL